MKNFFNKVRPFSDAIAMLGTLAGIVLAIIALVKGDVKNSEDLVEFFKYVLWGLMFLFLSVFVIALLLAYRNGVINDEKRKLQRIASKLEDVNNRRKQVASMIHNIAHVSRDISVNFGIFDKKISGVENLGGLDMQLRKEMDGYTDDVLSNLKNMFDVLTKDETSASIKFFDYLEENGKELIIVSTHRRDNVSKRKRGSVDSSMPYYSADLNTAFREIIHSENRSYYYNNDLKNTKDYDNSHSNWHKFYNACLVSSIIIANPDLEEYNTVGAVCIDNFKGNFDDDITHNILATVTDTYASVLSKYYALKRKIEEHN